MFSQIDETSTDGEDNDSDEEASDSFQDPDDLSEPEMEMNNKHVELKIPLLEKFATVSKPPAFCESQANVETFLKGEIGRAHV